MSSPFGLAAPPARRQAAIRDLQSSWGRIAMRCGPDPGRSGASGSLDGSGPGLGSNKVRPMLVLTRKAREKLYIGSDICITVVRLDGRQVRLGIEAPRQVPVVRAELVRTSTRAADVGAAAGVRREPDLGAAPSLAAADHHGAISPAPAVGTAEAMAAARAGAACVPPKPPLTGHVRPGPLRPGG